MTDFFLARMLGLFLDLVIVQVLPMTCGISIHSQLVKSLYIDLGMLFSKCIMQEPVASMLSHLLNEWVQMDFVMHLGAEKFPFDLVDLKFVRIHLG